MDFIDSLDEKDYIIYVRRKPKQSVTIVYIGGGDRGEYRLSNN